MSFENSTPTVKPEKDLPVTKGTPEKDFNIPSDRCTCIEKITCNYCCIQQYRKAWSDLRKTYTDKSTLCYSEALQREIIPDYQDGKNVMDPQSNDKLDGKNVTDSQCSDKSDDKNVTDPQSNDKLDGKNVTDSQCSDESDGKNVTDSQCNDESNGKNVTDSQCNDKSDLKQTVDCVNSECNFGSSEKPKDESVCDNLEQMVQSCDIKTSSTECSLSQKSTEKTNTELSRDSVIYSHTRTRRCIKRKRDVEDSCPVCGLTVRVSELENHFAKEVENLSKIPKNVRERERIIPPLRERGVNNTFVQVKCNRENRLSAKVAKYGKKTVNQINCPVCCLRLTGSEDEINEHVLNCSTEDFDSDIDVTERDDSFEEYEFGNETRVRAISFVPGGYRALHGHSSKSKSSGDNDEDLNVDVDDTLTYGKPQYTELDIIHNQSVTDATELEHLEQLRKSVLNDPTLEPNIVECRKWSNISEEAGKNYCLESTGESSVGKESEGTENKDNPGNVTQDVIVSSLKEKIKTLEEQNKSVKCLICLEPYTKPVVSTTCWHVHCEECWLMTMGVKKLCPQCNLIVFPSDLRRIYL